MAITQTFAAPPTPPSSTDKTNFRTRYDAFLAYIQALGTGLSAFITQANALETNVNAKEVTCTSAALSSSASANFQGTWVNQTTALGQSWAFNGIIYRVLIAGNTSPVASPLNWLPITYKECTLATPIASANTTTIGTAASGDTVHITGLIDIYSFGISTTGTLRIVVFDGLLALVHNATSFILPTGANIITVAGDTAEFVCENGASGYWRCMRYQRKDGTALSIGTPALPSATTAVTQASSDNSTKIATTAWAKLGFSSVLGANGYLKLPDWLGGIIFQWGTYIGSIAINGGALNVTPPLTFPANVFYSGVSIVSGGGANQALTAPLIVATTLSNIQIANYDSDSTITQLRWFSIGN